MINPIRILNKSRNTPKTEKDDKYHNIQPHLEAEDQPQAERADKEDPRNPKNEKRGGEEEEGRKL